MSHFLVFVVGRRINVDFGDQNIIPEGVSNQDNYITSHAAHGKLFQTDAADYLLFSKGTFDWSRIVDVIIGRPGYDNYLVDYVFHRRSAISFVDATNASKRMMHQSPPVLVVHQTDQDGVKAGFRNNPDVNWNLRIIGEMWYMGRTEFSSWRFGRIPRSS